MRLKRRFGCIALCLCTCFFLFSGCRAENAQGMPPALQFTDAPLTLQSGDFVLEGRLTYGGTDGLILTAENPESIRGCVFSGLGGELSISFGSVRVSAAQTAKSGCISELFQAIRSFESAQPVYSDGSWQLEEEHLRLICDEKGKVQEIEQTQSGWKAVFR